MPSTEDGHPDRIQRALDELATRDRLLRVGWSIAIGLGVAFAIVVWRSQASPTTGSGNLGGDWVAFWGAGTLFRREPALLLDLDAQISTMAVHLDGRIAPFPYPPLLAALYVLPALLPFTAGYVLVVVVLAIVAAVATGWALAVLDVPGRWWPVARLAALVHAGTAVAVFGAQTVILLLAVLCGGCLLLDRDRPVAAGCVIGLAWFKPQFALPFLLLLLVAGHRRTAVIGLLGAPVVWAANAVVFGTDWVTVWWDQIVSVVDAGNQAGNIPQTVSIVEWLRASLPPAWGTPVALSVAAILGVVFAVHVRRNRDVSELLPVALAALVVTAIHALHYDLALLVPVLFAVAIAKGRPAVTWLVLAWVAAIVVVVADIALLGVSYAVVVAAVIVRQAGDGHKRPLAPAVAPPVAPRT